MTVSYAKHVHTVSKVGNFLRLLKIWRGSLFKSIWRDLISYLCLYTIISLLYRYVLCIKISEAEGKLGKLEGNYAYEEPKKYFEYACVYCGRFSEKIPLSFLLGFYVSLVMTRWWNQFQVLSWPDELAMNLCSYLPGQGKPREIRRAVVRWICLANVLALRMVSHKVKKLFPNYQKIVDFGLMTPNEMKKLEDKEKKVEEKHNLVWYPILWAQNLLGDARREGLLKADLYHVQLINQCNKVASNNTQLICYGWINIPLVYTQVVTIAVYAYFLASLFGGQFLSPQWYKRAGNVYVKVSSSSVVDSVNLVGYDSDIKDIYVPVFNILEFIFYMGWLQVAVTLINPFGEDDDDFDVNYMWNRNVQIALLIVDEDSVELEPCPFGERSVPSHLLPCSSVEPDYPPEMPTEDVKISTSVFGGSLKQRKTGNKPRRKSVSVIEGRTSLTGSTGSIVEKVRKSFSTSVSRRESNFSGTALGPLHNIPELGPYTDLERSYSMPPYVPTEGDDHLAEARTKLEAIKENTDSKRFSQMEENSNTELLIQT